MPDGLYYKKNKDWVIEYKHNKQTVTHVVPGEQKSRAEFFKKNAPPAQTTPLKVQFDLTQKQVPDYATLKLIPVHVPVLPQPNSNHLQQIQPPVVVKALPQKFAQHSHTFINLKTENGLTREEKQDIVLEIIDRKEGLTEKDVGILLQAANQSFPLAFDSADAFQKRLFGLITAISKKNGPKLINSFAPLIDEQPICIMIHGSSVGGLRGKKKDDKGWSFDEHSDIDVSIIDLNRFCWAQALGIITYSDTNSIELNDMQIRLLKLGKFVSQFRSKFNRQANFCIYRDEESARAHADFTLVCKIDRGMDEFVIEKIYTPFIEKKSATDDKPFTLSQFFGYYDSTLRVQQEEWATNELWEERRNKITLPSQGNHAFNDLHAILGEHIGELRVHLDPFRPALSETPHVFKLIDTYLQGLESILPVLEFLSRDLKIATSHHGKNANQIMRGFNVESDMVNDREFGNACTYFHNCSRLLCQIAIERLGNPKQIAFIIPPLKKSFTVLLDSVIDAKLIVNLKLNKTQKYAYVLDCVKSYTEGIRYKANVVFKGGLDTILARLLQEKEFAKLILSTGNTVTTTQVLNALDDSIDDKKVDQL
ncbi:hypothetical protein [Jeongeupia sp. USM3]|uniref:hypothetical protein n=1 Tax=Jeongeupia sp. USM3 TaxID=1906741 RepID=UPI00089DD87F|nr:hypothetical protein [Jeongeupia sp. USM3]AOY01839.1 hypothetical protein BJP62_16130 [Jeongeupia sp. USM3]